MQTYPIYQRALSNPRLVYRGNCQCKPHWLGLYDTAITKYICRSAGYELTDQIADVASDMDRWIIYLFDEVNYNG